MKNYPSTRFVFDRKKTASKTQEALIQVEVQFKKKKKYVGTGVRVALGQWDNAKHVVNRPDKTELNRSIEAIKNNIDDFIDTARREWREFSWEEFDLFIENQYTCTETFADWVERRIIERSDLRESTKKTHNKLPTVLREFGRITKFADITKSNVRDFYEWLQKRRTPDGKIIRQATVWSYMKFMRVYVHDAMARDLVVKDPFVGLKVRKGESEPYRWLTQEEVKKMARKSIKGGSYSHVRDLFLLQCYTGLAYADLMDLRRDKIEKEGRDEFIVGRRLKTGEEYIVLLLPEAKALLEKYEYDLPHLTNQQYNQRLKKVAELCEIEKPIASHWGRRTAGMIMLNKGVRLEVVSRVLGHASVKTTEACYASILRKTVVSEMKKMVTGKKAKGQ